MNDWIQYCEHYNYNYAQPTTHPASLGCRWRCRGSAGLSMQYWSVWLTLPFFPCLSFSPSTPSLCSLRLSSHRKARSATHHSPFSDPAAKPYIAASPRGIWTSKSLTASEVSSSLTVVAQGGQRWEVTDGCSSCTALDHIKRRSRYILNNSLCSQVTFVWHISIKSFRNSFKE